MCHHRSVALIVLALGAFLLTPSVATAVEPADPDLIPEARRVLDYLEDVYGERSLTGIAPYGGGAPMVLEVTGREPAIITLDAFGWNKPTFGESYRRVMDRVVAKGRRWWHEKGGIVAMQFHWGKPGDPRGSAWVKPPKGTGPVDLEKTVTPGTPEHEAMMKDLRRTADYLERLAEDDVPILWRPLHEIDGGWFWWTDKEHPENTAKLWRILFDYLVEERGLHNLIWVWNPAHVAHGAGRDATEGEKLAYRKRFYPGDDYVDFVGMDVYPNEYAGWGKPWESSYVKGYEIMEKLAPEKLIALCECAALPDPEKMAKDGAVWLYCLPWFGPGNSNPAHWIRESYGHELMVTLDELPKLVPHNTAPIVRITSPDDGGEVAGSTMRVHGHVTDRDGNLDRVEVYLIGEPWRNWHLRDDEDVLEAADEAKKLGTATVRTGGEWTFNAEGVRAGCWNVVALAHDDEGATGRSNVARVAVGAENLAHGRTANASSRSEHAGQAVDDDMFTSWNGKDDGPQWLSVDLGSKQKVGAVVVSWWKAYASDYEVQVSFDGEKWRTAGRIEDKSHWHGDADVFRFEPVEARHVRIRATELATSWGGYTVYDLAVFESLPETSESSD